MAFGMTNQKPRKKLSLALVAHDACKKTLISWVQENEAAFQECRIFSTGTTGGLLQKACPKLDVTPLKSGPLGGDQQIGAMICEGDLQALIFFIDPMSPMPHDVDVKALTRLAIVYDLPMACSASTADLIVNAIRQS